MATTLLTKNDARLLLLSYNARLPRKGREVLCVHPKYELEMGFVDFRLRNNGDGTYTRIDLSAR